MDGEGSFAAVLRAARHAAGLTLEELADVSGVSVRALSDMERGRALGPQRRTVALIADALKLEGVCREEFAARAKAGRTRSVYLTAAPGLCELPGSVGDFTGRAAELAWIFRLVDALDESGDWPGAAVISGGAGLGKTTLVVRAAHCLRDRFPDGVYFVDALGMSGRPVASDEILARVLRALGVRDQQIPQDAAERAGRYRQVLRDRRVLVIMDDAASESQVRPMLSGAGRSQVLVTSRRLLAGLEGVRRLHLDPMPAADASDLLRRILAERADVPHDSDLQRLVDLLGGLPLAVRIVGNRLVSRPIWSAADLVERLSVAERRLDQLSAGDLTVAAAFDMSYEQLPEATRQLFRRVALLLGPDFSASLAAVVGGIGVPAAEDELDDLVDLGLMEAAESGRYRFHDLVRLYGQQRLDEEEAADAVTAARRRMVAWLLHTLTTAGQWFEPGGTESDFASAEDAERWIRMECEHWFPALGAAALIGDHRAVVQAVGALHWFSDRWAHWPRWSEVFTLGLDSAVRLGDASLQAEFLNYIAWTHSLPWRVRPIALEYAGRALDLARQAGDVLQQAWAQHYIAIASRKLGDPRGALDAARVAAELFERTGDVDAICQSLLIRGDLALEHGDPAEALTGFQRALSLVEDPVSGMTPTIAEETYPHVLGRVALVLGRLGRAAEGIPLALRAVDLLGDMHFVLPQAIHLRMLGLDLYGDEHPAEARDSLLRAADLFESIGRHDQAAACRANAAAHGAAGIS